METKRLHGVWAGPMHAADLKVGQIVRSRMAAAGGSPTRGQVLGWNAGAVKVEFGPDCPGAICWVPIRDLDLYVSVGEGTVTP